MKKSINSSQAPAPIGPYSQAIFINGFLFVSGQVAKDEKTGKLVVEEIKAETKQVMENIGHILKEAGLDFSHVVKSTIFLTDMNNFSKVNEVYGSFFSDPFPARETVQVSKLPLNVNVEISVIAIK